MNTGKTWKKLCSIYFPHLCSAVLDSLAVQVLPGVSLAFRLLGGVVISYCFWKAYNLEMLFAFPISAGIPCCAVVRGTKIRAGNKIGQGMALFFCTENETYACLFFFKQSYFLHPYDLAKVGVTCLNMGRLGGTYYWSLGAICTVCADHLKAVCTRTFEQSLVCYKFHCHFVLPCSLSQAPMYFPVYL